MKKVHIAAAVAAVALLLGGCGTKNIYDVPLPDQPVAFNTKLVTDPNDESIDYAALDFKGKTYVGYGELNGELTESDIGSCLGYLVQDGQKIEEIRIFTLASDPDMNYIFTMDNQGIMEKPTFFRNEETRERDIDTPAFIESSGYTYWE